MSIREKKFYEAAKIKRVRAHLDEIPEDCGYEKKFRYNIDMNSNGIMGDCIEWCQVNCEGKWDGGLRTRTCTTRSGTTGRNRTPT